MYRLPVTHLRPRPLAHIGPCLGNPPCTPDATSPTQKGRVDDWYIAAKIYGESIDRYKGDKTSYAESARQQSLAWERLKLAFED